MVGIAKDSTPLKVDFPCPPIAAESALIEIASLIVFSSSTGWVGRSPFNSRPWAAFLAVLVVLPGFLGRISHLLYTVVFPLACCLDWVLATVFTGREAGTSFWSSILTC